MVKEEKAPTTQSPPKDSSMRLSLSSLFFKSPSLRQLVPADTARLFTIAFAPELLICITHSVPQFGLVVGLHRSLHL